MRLDLTGPNYANDADVARLAGEYLRRLGSLPEVESAAITGPAMATDNPGSARSSRPSTTTTRRATTAPTGS